METTEKKLKRLKEIYEYCQKQAHLSLRKAYSARSNKANSNYFEKYQQYNDFAHRCQKLATSLHSKKIFGVPYSWIKLVYADYKELKAARKQAGRIKFETIHRVQTWFMQSSFSADYGTYHCDSCGNTFYHSPSTISLGKSKIIDCSCGHCTNKILAMDGVDPRFA